MGTKPRSDSTLDSLTPVQKERLREWLVDENLSYQDARERLYQDFNVRTSLGALSRFYATRCFALRSSEAKDFAEQVVKDLTADGAQFDEATIALVKQKAFERAYARDGNLEDLALLAKIIGDSAKVNLAQQKLSLDARRVKLLEAKAAQADQAKNVTADAALTPEQRDAKLKEIFGLR